MWNFGVQPTPAQMVSAGRPTGAIRECRLVLTALTAEVLKCGAELLTLRVPDRM